MDPVRNSGILNRFAHYPCIHLCLCAFKRGKCFDQILYHVCEIVRVGEYVSGLPSLLVEHRKSSVKCCTSRLSHNIIVKVSFHQRRPSLTIEVNINTSLVNLICQIYKTRSINVLKSCPNFKFLFQVVTKTRQKSLGKSLWLHTNKI